MSAIIEFGFNAAAVERGLSGLERRISGFGASVGKSMPNLTGMLGLGAVGAAIKGTLGEFDDLADTALKLNESTEVIQRVKFAADQAGTSIDGVAGAALKLEKALGDVENTKAAEALAHLGITGQSLAEMSLDEKMIALSGAFEQARATGTGYNDIVDLMGKSAGELIPLLSAGKEGLEAMFANAPVLADSAVQNMAAMNDKVDGFVARTKAGFGALIALGQGVGSMIGGASFEDAFSTPDGQAAAEKKREADRLKAAAAQEENRQIAANAAAEKEAAATAEKSAKEKETALSRVKNIQESLIQLELSRMAPAERLVRLAEIQKQKIDEMRAAGGLFFEATVQGMQQFADAQLKNGSAGMDKTFERLQEIKRLQDQMNTTQGGLRDTAVADTQAAQKAKAAEAEAWWEQMITEETERQTQLESARDLAGEMALLSAKANGQTELVKQIERELAIRERIKELMSRTGMGEDEARGVATKMQALQEKAAARDQTPAQAAADKTGKIMGFSRQRQGGAYERQDHLYGTDPNRNRDNPMAAKAAANAVEKGGPADDTSTKQTALQLIQQILGVLSGSA